MPNTMKVFCGTANRTLAERICEHLNIRVGDASVRRFADGEVAVKIEEDVRGADIFVVQSTSPPVNDHLMELVLLMDAFKRASAERITAVIPYFGYARQDRKDEGRVPISAKLVANMIVAAGAGRVLALDLHAAQLQGFFDIPVDHLYAAPVLTRYFRRLAIPDLTVVAPDVGSSKLARSYSKRLLTQAARTVRDLGAKDVYLAATHAVLSGSAMDHLDKTPLEQLVVTDTIPVAAENRRKYLKVLSVARLLGEAILRIHHAESVSKLFDVDPDE
ncbi:MAG: ribose-phosphate diphosphokinase [Planctomycetota bacterium]